MDLQQTEEDESPRSLFQVQTDETKEASNKLKRILHGAKLEELPLDFIATTFFADLYLLDTVMGSGAFGVVLKIVERSTGNEFAMKVTLL